MAEVSADLKAVRRQCESGPVPSASSDATTARMGAVTGRQRVEWRRLLSRRNAVALTTVVILAAVMATVLFFRRTMAPLAPGSKSVNVNSPGYDDYLHGKVLVGVQNRGDNETAIERLQRAVKADSGIAPYWAELARAYAVKAFYVATQSERKQFIVEAEKAVERALTLDSNLAEAHAARAFLLWSPAKGFPHEQAIQGYQRALALNPNLEEARHQLGTIYFHIGLLDKAWGEIKAGLAINPANTLMRFRFGVINIYLGKVRRSPERLEKYSSRIQPLARGSQCGNSVIPAWEVGRDISRSGGVPADLSEGRRWCDDQCESYVVGQSRQGARGRRVNPAGDQDWERFHALSSHGLQHRFSLRVAQ